jgi:hypothetical protein
VHLSFVEINTISKRTKTSFHLTMLLRSTIRCVQNKFHDCGTFSANRASTLRRDQHSLQMDRNVLPLNPRHLEVLSGVSKMISKLTVHSAQTMHLSCTDINSVSKRIKRFHLTHVT